MTVYFVSGHGGAIEWAARRGIEAVAIRHLDISTIESGDMVIGTLPVHLVAEINARGARYLHLSMDLPETARGRELTADDMDAYGARIEGYKVERAG